MCLQLKLRMNSLLLQPYILLDQVRFTGCISFLKLTCFDCLGPILPSYLSYASRIQSDEKKACEVAALLDEDRNIPEECRLSSLIDDNLYPGLFSYIIVFLVSSL